MGVEFVGRGTLLIHGHAHFFELMQDEFDALIHGHAMSDETVQRLGDWIVLVTAYAVGIEACRSLLLLLQYPRRNSRCSRPCRNILHHDRIGTDLRTVADGDRAEYLGARPHHHAVAQRRVALAFLPGSAAQCDAMVQGHVIADLGGLADHHAHAVIDEKSPPDGRTGMYPHTPQPPPTP